MQVSGYSARNCCNRGYGGGFFFNFQGREVEGDIKCKNQKGEICSIKWLVQTNKNGTVKNVLFANMLRQ